MGNNGKPPSQTTQIADFITKASYDSLTEKTKQRLKIHVLDTVGCAIGALGHGPTNTIREYVKEFPARGRCTLIGGGKTSPDRAALMNGALVRYLDFMDNFLAKGETCHPSDNFAAVLAAAEHADCSGEEFMIALAVAYEIQLRLTQDAPIMKSGFDHTTQLAFSIAAGATKALRLNGDQTVNALAIGGVNSISLAVIRASPVSQWKGLASAGVASRSLQNVFLAQGGVTGPQAVFEGTDGFMEALGKKFHVDWNHEGLELINRAIIKKYNAEVHTQSVLEGVLELRQRHNINACQVRAITIDVFKTTFEIVGGGKFGDKHTVRTKEDADHSLPYMTAIALLDGDVWPEQFAPERIGRSDVQALLQKVTVRPKRLYTMEYPRKMDCFITIELQNGKRLTIEKEDYEGFTTRTMTWERVVEKFNRLTKENADAELQRKICDAVENLETTRVTELTSLLAIAGKPKKRGTSALRSRPAILLAQT